MTAASAPGSGGEGEKEDSRRDVIWRSEILDGEIIRGLQNGQPNNNPRDPKNNTRARADVRRARMLLDLQEVLNVGGHNHGRDREMTESVTTSGSVEVVVDSSYGFYLDVRLILGFFFSELLFRFRRRLSAIHNVALRQCPLKLSIADTTDRPRFPA